MSVEEYSLKISKLSKYSPSFLANPRDEMICFMMGVADFVREEYCTEMLHDDMTVARLMVYAKSIEESKLRRMARSLNGSVLVTKIKLGLRRGLMLKKNLRVQR